MKHNIQKIGKSFLISLGPLVGVFIPYFLMRRDIWAGFVPRMYMGIGCGCLWLGLSPCLITRYRNITGRFFDEFRSREWNKADLSEKRQRFETTFLKDRFFVCFYLFWAVLVEGAILMDVTYLERFGIRGFRDPYLYLFCICMLYVLLLTAAGFAGVFHTLVLVYTLIREDDIEIHELDSDGVGGLGYAADYILETTRLFATGVLFVPIVLDYIYYTQYDLVRIFLYLIILVYGVAVVLLYLIPLKAIYQYGDSKKQKFLEGLRMKYCEIIEHLLEHGDDKNPQDELMALNIYNYIDMVERASSFQVEYRVMSHLAQLVVLPLLSLLINLNDIVSLVQSFWFF